MALLALAAAAVTVAFPGPGWQTVSPATGITLRGAPVAPGDVVDVSGSRSGEHRGRLEPLRLGPGAVFEPSRPFRAGERVTVRTRLAIEGAQGGTFSFHVAEPAPPPRGDHALEPGGGAGAHGPAPAPGMSPCRPHRHRLATRPDLHPVPVCVTHPADARAGAGAILVTPSGTRGHQQGLGILDDRGRFAWWAPRNDSVRDLKVVTWAGRTWLAYFQHRSRGRGSFYGLLDHRDRLRRRIRTGNGYRVNMHELQLTPQGTAYLAAYAPVLEPGTLRPVVDYVLQEVDVRTGQVLFEWHALDHVPTADSYRAVPPVGSWDYFHGNAIDPPQAPGDPIVVSARNTSTVYGIDRATGAIRWRLGGREDGFGLAAHPEWRFCAQHDARVLPDGDLTLFDNGGEGEGLDTTACPVHAARAEEFRLGAGTAELVRSYSSLDSSDTGAGFLPYALGSARREPGGDTLIDWGTTGRVTEVMPDGRVTLGLRLARHTYRAVRADWVGTPGGRPAMALGRAGRRITVSASWNGATRIDRWRALAGARRAALAPTGAPARFAGLETTWRIRTGAAFVAVEALDRAGSVLGRSRAVRVSAR